jgi:16S rRNA (cytosine967-C5)-methyltransferase
MDARLLALTVLLDWHKHQVPLDDVLDRQLKGPSDADSRLATELVYGVVRRMASLDWQLNRLLREPLAKLPPPIQFILRIGAYQLLFLDRIPASAAVNEAVNQAKRFGHAGTVKLTNAVLRNLDRQRHGLPWPTEQTAEAMAVRFSLPQWLAERWWTRYGPGAALHLAETMQQPAATHLRTNTWRCNREGLLQFFAEAGFHAEPLEPFPEAINLHATVGPRQWPGYAEGWWYVQDLGSMAVAHALDPQPGETVVDLCAAPGGKTTHMAALMGDQGRILAVDNQEKRIRRLLENVQRLGLSCIETAVGDAATMAPDRQADRVLVDAPCSGLGVIRRKPDIRWRVTPESLAQLLPVQQRLLRAAAAWVKPGGRLVYSTCSTEPEENGGQIAAFLADHPDFAPVPLPAIFPSAWTADQPVGQLSLLPHRHGTDGFYIACLQRQP